MALVKKSRNASVEEIVSGQFFKNDKVIDWQPKDDANAAESFGFSGCHDAPLRIVFANQDVAEVDGSN